MHSETINELAAALSKAQGQITGALKDSANSFFKSKYADLASCWDACRKQLADNGLAVIQTTETEGDTLYVVTTLAHASGQWIRGRLPVKTKDDGPQAQGSGLTYSRRYALAAIIGLAQIDDDAESAQGRKHSPMPDTPALTVAQQKSVASFCTAFHDLLGANLEENVIAEKMAALREEVNEDQTVFLEVWKSLDSKTRSAIKKYLDMANRKQK